jgi:hypothetical protein
MSNDTLLGIVLITTGILGMASVIIHFIRGKYTSKENNQISIENMNNESPETGNMLTTNNINPFNHLFKIHDTPKKKEEVFIYEASEESNNVISGYRWLATLDTRTCLKCGVLDGKIFDTLDDAPKDPCLRRNCRCVLLPYVKGFEDIPGERAAAGGPVPDTWTYEIWFKKQKKIIQRRILGPKYYTMFRGKKSLTEIAEFMDEKYIQNHEEAWINDYNDKELLKVVIHKV